MADEVQFSLVGIDALTAKLESVQHDVKRRGGRTALRKAAQLIANKAKENAEKLDDPDSAANIANNIAIRWSSRTYKRTGDLAFRVGVMGGASSQGGREGLPGGDTQHWRHQEFGTQSHPANPFFRRALSDNVQAATNVFLTEYEKAIDRAIKRAAK